MRENTKLCRGRDSGRFHVYLLEVGSAVCCTLTLPAPAANRHWLFEWAYAPHTHRDQLHSHTYHTYNQRLAGLTTAPKLLLP
jgi:hypothetical protein